jgi:hypothetical protein
MSALIASSIAAPRQDAPRLSCTRGRCLIGLRVSRAARQAAAMLRVAVHSFHLDQPDADGAACLRSDVAIRKDGEAKPEPTICWMLSRLVPS